MNLSTKKNIAREFLVLVVCVLITLITFFSTYLYNYYLQTKYNKIDSQLIINQKLSDSLNQVYYKKINNQYSFAYSFLQQFYAPNQTTTEQIWKRLETLSKNDSISLKWNSWDNQLIAFLHTKGFNSPEQFKKFIDLNTINPNDIEIQNRVLILREKIKSYKTDQQEIILQKFSSQESSHYSFIAFILLLFSLMLCRYMYYGICWSIKTLNQEVDKTK